MILNNVILNCFQKVSGFGDTFFDSIFGTLGGLPGFIKGVIAIVILTLMGLGVLSLLKKSLKIFGIVLSIFFIIVLVSLLLNK